MGTIASLTGVSRDCGDVDLFRVSLPADLVCVFSMSRVWRHDHKL